MKYNLITNIILNRISSQRQISITSSRGSQMINQLYCQLNSQLYKQLIEKVKDESI